MKKFIALILLICSLMALDLAVGAVNIFSLPAPMRTMILNMRILKAATAVLAGIALSVSGLQMQTLFRNPLAGPYVLGLSSGASLGVALLLLVGVATPLGVAGAAMAGAAVVMGLLLLVNERVSNVMTLLILGILFSSAIGSVVQILQYISDEQSLKNYVVWTMGSLGEVTRPQILILAVAVSAGMALAIFTLKPLNLLMIGEAYARSVGLNLRRSRLLILASTTLLAGGVTAFCGPIGFIGLAVPHLARGVFHTADHRVLVPASALVGIALLLACDVVSRQFLIPINAVTSLAGIPVVIYIIVRK